MIQLNVFPGGKKKIVTFSYDDGHPNDVRLLEIFNKYGVKGTFHLNDERGDFKARKDILREIYAGHEISCHTSRHGWLDNMPKASLINEIFENRRILEEVAGYPVVGMSYPSGAFSAEAEDALAACGIVYSRTTLATMNFLFPKNFLEWHPTCHHNAAKPLCEKFMASVDSEWSGPMLYIWGHAHEFRCEEDWQYIEALVASVAGSEKIWYATNIEIYDYKMAQRALRVSADEKTLYNPSAIDVWVGKNKSEIICIPAGKTVKLDR
ncbi:MAG: polysaccharide deacetylase family protein [Clostridia bacterium]|nr:polysaccharide deacetylase family protein [Clostridia bacterium]